MALPPNTAMVPKKLLVLERLIKHLEGIEPSNVDPSTDQPFDIDLRKSVLLGVARVGPEQKVPFLGLLEPPVPTPIFATAGENQFKRQENFQVLLQGFAKDDKRQPTKPAYWMCAQVMSRLGRLVAVNRDGDPKYPDEYLLNGNNRLVANLLIGQDVVRPPTDGVSETAFFYIPLVFELFTDVTNPYVAVAT